LTLAGAASDHPSPALHGSEGPQLDSEKDAGQAAITNASGSEPAAAGKALPTGARINEFEIIRVLGEGGFGIVYLAFDTLLHRHVAIKEYFPASYAVRRDEQTITALSPNHVDTYRAGMASFIEEARLLARFEHPALLKVLRYWEANGTAYMVMPHYQGRTLRDLLKMPDEFSTEIELRALAAPLLDAVAVMHEEHCFHRDISPENIIIRPNGGPVLLDFGAARRILADSTAALTVVLKQNYAPIEQYSDDGALAQGPWTDIYALAAVIYTAIMRKPPPSAVARVYQDPVKPLAKVAPPGFTLQFLRGIDAGMAVKPEDRPRSIAAFKEALGLESATRAVTKPAPVLPPEPPKPAPAAKPAPPPVAKDPSPTIERERFIVTPDSRYVPPAPAPKSRAAALAIAGLAVVAIVAGGAYFLGKRADEPAQVATPPMVAPAPVPTVATTTPPATPAPIEPPKAAEPPAPAPPPPPVEPPKAQEPAPAAVEPPAPVTQPPPMAVVPPPAAEPAPATPKGAAPPPATEPPPSSAKAAPPPKEKEKERERAKEKEKAAAPKSAPAVAPPVAPPPQVAAVKPAPVAPPPSPAVVAPTTPATPPPAAEPDVPRDLTEEGRKLYLAANRGDAGAQVALARLYAAGRGAPQSDADAARWMRNAADQGNVDAWHALGVLYEGGRGVPKDGAEAARWYRRAAERGNPTSQNNLGAMYASGGAGVPKDDAEAVAWYRKAADQGNARGQYNLAMMYLAGQGVGKDEAEAARLLRRAADQGLASAQYQLGTVYAAGLGVMRDEGEALVWYRKAAAQGNAQAAARVKQLEGK
jgi:serine/threonine protein kinase